MRVGIVGAGRTGLTIGYLLKRAGWTIVSLVNRTRESSERAAEILGCEISPTTLEVAEKAELLLITTPDGVIEKVCEEIARRDGFRPGQFVVHMSGALGLDILAGAAQKGAFVASIHPGQSFARFDPATTLEGVYFAIEAEGEALSLAASLVEVLRGIPIQIRPGMKPLYHASLCVASNYLVGIMDLATALLKEAGLEPDEAHRAVLPLAEGTLRNFALLGSEGALTGPIARGDLETVRLHLSGLEGLKPVLSSLYRLLGIHTADIALRKGSIDKATHIELVRELGGDGRAQAFRN